MATENLRDLLEQQRITPRPEKKKSHLRDSGGAKAHQNIKEEQKEMPRQAKEKVVCL